MTADVSSIPSGFQACFDAVTPALQGDLLSLKESAWERFQSLGFPTRRQESWRYVNLSDLENAFAEGGCSGATVATSRVPSVILPSIVLDLSSREVSKELPAGVRLTPLSRGTLPERFSGIAVDEGNPFESLNTALFGQGWVLRLEGTHPEPLYVVHGAPQGAGARSLHPRLYLDMAPGAEATLIEEFGGGSSLNFSNPVTEINLGSGSRLRHQRLVAGNAGGWHIGSVAVAAGRDSTYSGFSIVIDSGFVRVDVTARLEEPGAQVNLLGLYATHDKQVVDHHTHITHAARDTGSRQLYRGILSGRSRGVFNGRITIAQDAQGVSADQVNNNLLLSEQALVQTNPQLEIFADDVSCRHGATIGRLEEAKVFYLRARGIPQEKARALLTQAFLDEVLEELSPEAMRTYIHETIKGRFFAGV